MQTSVSQKMRKLLFCDCATIGIFFRISATGIVHRFCSNETIPNIANFVSVSCSYKHAFIVDNVDHTDYEADFCEPCFDEDGCNGASGYGPIALLIVVPVTLMKILSF